MNTTAIASPRLDPRARHGFALVIVLVILSLMAIIAVGYLSSMASERATANAFCNKVRAEQAAQAGVDTAMGILRDYFKAFPDSATVWDTTQYANPTAAANPSPTPAYAAGTTLYLRAVPQANNANLPDPNPGVTGDPYYSPNANYTGGNGPNNGVSPSSSPSQYADNRKTFVLPLVSGAQVQPLASPKPNLVTFTSSGYVNLNARSQLGDIQGWIGTPPAVPSGNPVYPANSLHPQPVNVPWVEITQRDGVTNPAQAPVIGRYAFWVEDESFRANVSYAGLGQYDLTSTNYTHLRRDNNASAAPNPTDADLLGLLTFINDPSPTADAKNIFDARNVYPGQLFPEARAFTHAAGLGTDAINALRYLTTSQSAALNLTRHGTQRLCLNDVVYPPANASFGSVQNQIDKIVQTIQFHAPNFGQRFYRTTWSGTPPVVATSDLNNSQMVSTTTATPHALIYLYKIAANLRDYIDADVLPTVVNADPLGKRGLVWTGGRPTKTINDLDGPNPEWAVGKDAAPVIQECAMRYAGSISGTGPTARYTVYVDYYIEMWNMGTRTVTGQDLGPHAFIRVRDQPIWYADNTKTSTVINPLTDDSGISLSDTTQRDFDIDISQVSFPPGVCTVITTDTSWNTTGSSVVYPPLPLPTDTSIVDTNPLNVAEGAKHFVVCPISSAGGKRMFTGPIPNCNEVRMVYRYKQASTSSDYETEIIAGNDNGYIDSLAGAVPIVGGTISIPRASSARIVNGGYLRGNIATGYAADGSSGGGLQPSAIGDPRTNNEQLAFVEHVASGTATDQTGYKEFDKNPLANSILPSFGLPNLNSIAPAKPRNPWPDYYWFPGSAVSPGAGATATMTAATAPAVFANAPLTSIGQIGDIFDPARLPAVSGGDITASRGGGRTFRIGQHDDLCDNTTAYSASSTWAAWRLADIFSVSNAIELPGLININGLARDNGAALMAAFQGFNFQPKTQDPGTSGYDPMLHNDDSIAGKTFDAAGLQNLINDVINSRLKNTDPTKPGPFFERGELSETPILNPANATSTTLVNGVDTKTVFDRGREEIVRRLIDMTTTRGSVFTVYALGQAINQTTAGGVTKKNVIGTHQLRVTFKLTPKKANGDVFHPGTDSNGNPTDFDPTDTQQVNNRFLKPDHYDIEVLSATSGSSS